MEIDIDKTLDVGVEWRAAAQVGGGAERRRHRGRELRHPGRHELTAGRHRRGIRPHLPGFGAGRRRDRRKRHPAGRDEDPRHRGRPPGVGGEQQPEHPFVAPPAHAEQQGGGGHRRREHPLHHQHLPRLDEPRQRHQHRRAQGRRRHVADHATHPRERIREPGHLPGGVGPEAGCLDPGPVGLRRHDLDETRAPPGQSRFDQASSAPMPSTSTPARAAIWRVRRRNPSRCVRSKASCLIL